MMITGGRHKATKSTTAASTREKMAAKRSKRSTVPVYSFTFGWSRLRNMSCPRCSRPLRGRRSAVDADDAALTTAARLAATLTLHRAIGAPAPIKDLADGYEGYLGVLAPRSSKQRHLFQSPWEAWYAKRNKTEATQALFPTFERAWYEFLKLSLAAWRKDVFEETESHYDQAAANQVLPVLTLQALLAQDEVASGAVSLGKPHRGKILQMLTLGIRAGGLVFDWLVAGHIPAELEAWVDKGRAAEEAFKLAEYDGVLTTAIFVKITDDHRLVSERKLRVHPIQERWGYFGIAEIPARSPRKKPDLKLYTLPDLLYMGVLWHVLESTEPYVPDPQLAAHRGAPGVVLGQFETGEILVHLDALRAVLIEGRIRNLDCQNPRTAGAVTVLSLRTPDHKILATIFFRQSKDKIGIAQGMNGLYEQQLDPHVVLLLSSLWSSRTFDGVLDARRLRTMLPPQPKKLGIRWAAAADVFFEWTRAVAPEDMLTLFDLRRLDVTGLPVEERLGLYWEITSNQAHWTPKQVGAVKQAMPADLNTTVEKSLRVASTGSWNQNTTVHSDDGQPIAFASNLYFEVPSVEVKLDATKLPQGKLFVSWMQALSFNADQVTKRTPDDAEKEFERPRILVKEVLPQKSPRDARWGGKWQEKVVVRPESGWHMTEDRVCDECHQTKPAPGMFGSGRGMVKKYDCHRSRGGGRVSLRPANLIVTQQMSKHAVFTMKVGTADIDVASDRSGSTAIFTFKSESGKITLSDVPKGWATAARLTKLGEQWSAWAKKQLALQFTVHRDLPQWLVLNGDDLQSASQHLDGQTSDARTDLWEAKKKLTKATADARTFEKKRAKWMRLRSGQAARMPVSESTAAFRRHERLRRAMRI